MIMIDGIRYGRIHATSPQLIAVKPPSNHVKIGRTLEETTSIRKVVVAEPRKAIATPAKTNVVTGIVLFVLATE